ncbi:hypothetical protein G7085_13365 [Tessaracoccus sp. HDW20]|nr:hypothetical protein [Tessaracoccus coleopterorum]
MALPSDDDASLCGAFGRYLTEDEWFQLVHGVGYVRVAPDAGQPANASAGATQSRPKARATGSDVSRPRWVESPAPGAVVSHRRGHPKSATSRM